MKSKQTAILLVFLFVLMASATAFAQPRDVQESEEMKSPEMIVETIFDLTKNGRTNTEASATTVEKETLNGGVVEGNSSNQIKVLDRFELRRLKDDYFTRTPIILLQNSRAKTDG